MLKSRKSVMGLGVLVLLGIALGPFQAGAVPEVVEIDELSELFEGVNFDHSLHTMIVDDCAVCHHHTTGTGVQDPECAKCHSGSPGVEQVACRDCHEANPFSAEKLLEEDTAGKPDYHLDQIGLKGAYHQSCLGCHRQMGAPTGCQDCHVRTPAGDAFYHEGTGSSGEETGQQH